MEETSSEEDHSTSPAYSDGDEAPPSELLPEQPASDCEHCSFDAIVVGSGYGGAVAACRLAEAGLRVCLLERGHRFTPEQFPRSLSRLLLNTAFHTFRTTIGRANALYQVHMQHDALAVVASGLGGGSLINAGLLMSTPKRTRSDPRWPIEWEQNWDLHERKARAMLGSQSLPLAFPSAKVMDAISGEIEDCVKDTVHLNVKMKAAACRACGNCFTGCPYDAKNSTDKNYIAAAVEASAHIYTECEVQYIFKNCTMDCEGEVETCQYRKKKKRRWRVYLNDVDFLLADYVVLSGGVLGTTGILMKSRERGLELSSKLGSCFSTNGNNVAYVAECQAPTAAYGLTEDNFSNIPMPLRPGPSISNSFTSSLGFTIQSAVLPLAFPNLLFKGVFTYQWEGHGYGLLRGIWDEMKQWMGTKDSEALVLNMMGRDAADGRVELDFETGRLKLIPPHDPLLSKKMLTFHKLSKRLGGTLFMSRHRSTSVHLLGACPAAHNAQDGVVNPYGQVFKQHATNRNFTPQTTAYEMALSAHSPTSDKISFSSIIDCNNVHPGLYACDASILPCPIGINPSLTICTLAEHISSYIVYDAFKYLSQHEQRSKTHNFSFLAQLDPFNDSPKDYTHSYDQDHYRLDDLTENINRLGKTSALARSLDTNDLSHAIGNTDAIVRETMHGYLNGMPCTLNLVMHMGKHQFFHLVIDNPQSTAILKGRVGGNFTLKALDPYPMYIIDGYVDMCCIDKRTPFTQYMHYNLQLASASGARYMLHGVKEMRAFMLGLSLWEDSTTLHISLWQTNPPYSQKSTSQKVVLSPWHGTIRMSVMGLCQSLCTMKGHQRVKFLTSLAKSLMETYFWGRTGLPCNKWTPKTTNYPAQYIAHNITTEDGFEISCVQWPSLRMEGERGPVLLLNGYSTESFWLPTEERDLVRTLLQEGHEVWLLRMRLHPGHATSRPFTLDHLAKFDIPAACLKIHQVRKDMEKIHVVAHCVGGLSIHMAILGGYVPASSIATLTCTNSGMFFKVSTLARIKLWLPLIPISLALTGANQVLQLIAKSSINTDGWRHLLLKRIARAIPRRERCMCDECEVFSGIFGNTFWHDNVRLEMHEWLNRENAHRLPMQAFKQLRLICNAGALVDANGHNTYLPFVERLHVPTTYISGGRPLLVLPFTSEHSHAFLQLHHPHLPHQQFVIPNYGHSDLLIGEFAHRDVFPHIIDAISSFDTKQSSSTKHSTNVITWSSHTFQPNSFFYTYCTFFNLFVAIPFFYVFLILFTSFMRRNYAPILDIV